MDYVMRRRSTCRRRIRYVVVTDYSYSYSSVNNRTVVIISSSTEELINSGSRNSGIWASQSRDFRD